MSESTPVLRGDKIALRSFEAADITAAYLAWLNDPRVVRFSNQRFIRHDRDTCLRYLRSFAGSDNLFLSVRRLDTGDAIGTIQRTYPAPCTADVGILLGETSIWGQGYGQDAWNTLLSWLWGSGASAS